MAVVGLGTDIVECVRVRLLIDRHGETFLRRVYTKHEICACRSSARSTEAFALRWAAKEAVLKSLNIATRAPHRVEVEIRALGGNPQVILGGAMIERAAANDVSNVLLATAVTRKYATATALALRT